MNAFLIFTVLTVAVDLMVLRGTVQEYAETPLVFDGGAEANILPSEQDASRWDTRILSELGVRRGAQPMVGDISPSSADARPEETVGTQLSGGGLVGAYARPASDP